MRTVGLLIVTFIIGYLKVNAQTFDGARVYARAGGAFSKITDLQTTLLSEPFFTNATYTFETKRLPGVSAGFGTEVKFGSLPLSLNPELLYVEAGTIVDFKNVPHQWGYRMSFKYKYVYIPVMLKAYAKIKENDELDGVSLGIGIQPGFNVDPDNIRFEFKTYGIPLNPEFGTSLEQQQQLKNVLKGNNNIGFIVHGGLQFACGVAFEGRWYWGFRDAITTETNSYNFVENNNKHTFWEATIRWNFIPFN